MFKDLYVDIALKQLLYRGKQSLFSVITLSIGVMVLIVSLSLANGFEKELIDKILVATPHINVQALSEKYLSDYRELGAELDTHKEIKGSLPYINEQAIVSDSISSSKGILLRGVDFALEQKVRNLDKYLIDGELPANDNEVVIGSELARVLYVSVGDRISIVTEKGKLLEYKVSGIIRIGFYDYDSTVAFVTLKSLQNELGLPSDKVSGLNVLLKEPLGANDLLKKLKKSTLDGYFAYSWMDVNTSLLSAMALEKKVIFLVMFAIILIAAISTANTMILLVLEKKEDIGILMALGVSRSNIGKIFVVQGAIIAIVGIIVGTLLGLLICFYLYYFPLNLPQDVYFLPRLPVSVQVSDVIIIIISAFMLSVLSSFLPANRAGKLSPVEVLRS